MKEFREHFATASQEPARGGFGEGSGWIWGAFWEGFGRIWEPRGPKKTSVPVGRIEGRGPQNPFKIR